MRIRLYLEEDSMSQALVRGLRARGVDVITALQEGMIERRDEDHLEYATQAGRVLYSFNVATFTIFTANASQKARNTQVSFSHANSDSRSENSCAVFCGSSLRFQRRR